MNSIVTSSHRHIVTTALRHSLAIVAACAAVSFEHQADAQMKPASRYDVFDIGDLGGESGWHDFRYTAFAINENNSVAGYLEVRVSQYNGQYRALFWTPNSEHGFQAFTLYDLTALSGVSPADCPNGTCFGQAFDISDADVVVGSEIVASSTFPQAFVWDLPTNDDAGGLQTFSLGNLLADQAQGGGAAHGISDASTAIIVGEAYDEISGLTCSSGPVAFRLSFNGSPGTMTRIDSSNRRTFAYDVNEASPVLAVGQQGPACPSLGGCDAADDAVRWNLTSGGNAATLPEDVWDDTIARATNNSGESVGDLGDDPSGCPPLAAHWAADGTLTTIGDPTVTPEIAEGDSTRAWGMSPGASSDARVNVVGENATSQHALLWHRGIDENWSAYDLNWRIAPECAWTSLDVAFDTNGNGWVVGRGQRPDGEITRTRGFVLRPALCPADLNADGAVGSTDLGVLLGSWGVVGLNGSGVTSDLNVDGEVTSADLAILLGAWGDCPSGSVTCATSPNALAGPGTGVIESALSAALQLFGFSSVGELNAWAASASPESAAGVFDTLAEFMLAFQSDGSPSS